MTIIKQPQSRRTRGRRPAAGADRIRPALLLVALLAGCGPGPEPEPVSDSWARIAADGRPAAASADDSHACVLDRRTGLLWEVKQRAAGPHRFDATFSWYSDDRQQHMSEPGTRDGGKCDLASCDTQALVEAVNSRGLCDRHDWRLPTRDELLTLGDERLVRSGNALDPAFFPAGPPGEYWSASTFRLYPRSAWVVSTANGMDRAELKREARYARLVQGEVFNPRKPKAE